ncbi:MAG: hypothetical protein HY786_04765 [Deltaproteobacteria bacterium]|nr:hypothetical protein [Deltaproteobacteria bacterium]
MKEAPEKDIDRIVGVQGKQLFPFARTISADDLKDMERAIEDSCKRFTHMSFQEKI